MSKKIIILTILALMIIAGGVYWGIRLSCDQHTIKVKLGDNFSLTLESNPTTGYSWKANFNSRQLKLVSQKFEPRQSDDQQLIAGRGGQEVFEFQALKAGNTKIEFHYLRPWEKDVPAIKEVIYKIRIQ